ncbi:MAG TPA: hypothetical protein VFB32_05145 [Rudaea sp.]|nr:hypothetical protein [Rudaea sp.]
MKSRKVQIVHSFAVLAFALLAGCMAGVKNEDSSVVRTRAVERWEDLIAHKAEKAYDYLTPGYRATKTREAYAKEMNERGVKWSKVTFGSQDCDVDTCKVHLEVNYAINMGGPAGNVKTLGFVTENWVKVNGQWYYLPDQFQPQLGKDSGKNS